MIVTLIEEVLILIEIIDLIQENKLELLPGIPIVDGTLLHTDEDVWEAVAEVVKCLFA